MLLYTLLFPAFIMGEKSLETQRILISHWYLLRLMPGEHIISIYVTATVCALSYRGVCIRRRLMWFFKGPMLIPSANYAADSRDVMLDILFG